MTDRPENPDNPFGGGFDMNALLQQAQDMQNQLSAAQEELANATVDGTVAGVTVTVTGVGELTGVRFEPSSIDLSDPEALTDLADLVVAAYRDARAKSETMANEKLGPITGGLGMDALGGPGGGAGGPGGLPGGGQLGF